MPGTTRHSADELSSFGVVESIGVVAPGKEREHRVYALKIHIPAVRATVRQIELSTRLPDWFEREIRAAASDWDDALVSEVVEQAIIDFEHDSLAVIRETFFTLRQIALLKAEFGMSDPRRMLSEPVDYQDLRPSPPTVFDSNTEARAVRQKLKENWMAIFDRLLPVSRGRAPDLLPGEAANVEADVRRDFNQRKAAGMESAAGEPSAADTIRSMSAEGHYGPAGRALGESAIDHIVFPRKATRK